MTRTAADQATAAYLSTRGISASPDELDRMVREAVGRLQREFYWGDPRQDLSESEIQALERGGFDLNPDELGSQDPLAQTAALFAALLETSLSTRETAEVLGVDASRIRHRLSSSPPTVYGIRLDDGWHIPRYQLDGDKLLPGLGTVVASLDPQLHPVAVFRWLTTPHPDLVSASSLPGVAADTPLSPRDWLRLGYPPETVAELAAQL